MNVKKDLKKILMGCVYNVFGIKGNVFGNVLKILLEILNKWFVNRKLIRFFRIISLYIPVGL